jgi:hypothetical protein
VFEPFNSARRFCRVGKIAWPCVKGCSASRNFAHAFALQDPHAWASRRNTVPL